jgi:uncharacterized protein (DUF3084 family)
MPRPNIRSYTTLDNYAYPHTRKIKKPSLYSKKNDWNCFRETLHELITLEISLKTETDIEAVENITKAIQKSAWQITPDRNEQNSKEECPITVKQKTAEKRKAPKRYQLTKAPQDKQRYNKQAKELKKLLHNLKN